MTTICIPTRGRVGRVRTLEFMAGSPWLDEVWLVAPKDEAGKHQWPRVMAHDVEGIRATRQWIMDQNVDSKVIMVDDDLRFSTRRLDDPSKFASATPPHVTTIFNRLELMLDQVPLAGLAERSGANRMSAKDIPVSMSKRLFSVQAIDNDWFHRANMSYRIEFMSDFDLTLQCLFKGYPSALLTSHAKDSTSGSNAPGGCSIDRTGEALDRSARELARLWPDFVTLREAKEWKGIGPRTDVRVAWAKTAQAGIDLRTNLLGIDLHPTPDWSELAPEWTLL